MEWEDNFFIATLPPAFTNATLSYHNGLLFAEGDGRLAVFNKTGCLLQEEVVCFSVEENTLKATLPLFDSLRCTAECTWRMEDNKLVKEEFFVRVGEEELQEKLLPYVFFEHLLFGGNYEAFLSDELLPDKEKIKGFIGDFAGVHLTEDLSCALLRRKKENLLQKKRLCGKIFPS